MSVDQLKKDTNFEVVLKKKTILSRESQAFVCDVFALIQDLEPDLSREQASRALSRHILQKENTVKKNIVKFQASTTSRSSVTVEQQSRWHKTYDNVLNTLREKTTGKCRKSGKNIWGTHTPFHSWR